MDTMHYRKLPLDGVLIRKARLLALAGDETRIRILCFMFKYKKACVSDIAQSLAMSVPSISHHLQIMKDNDFFATERMGNKICYILKKSAFTRGLEKVICDFDMNHERSDS